MQVLGKPDRPLTPTTSSIPTPWTHWRLLEVCTPWWMLCYVYNRPRPFTAIGIAVEVWTTNAAILFDNFLVSSSTSAAANYATKTFKPVWMDTFHQFPFFFSWYAHVRMIESCCRDQDGERRSAKWGSRQRRDQRATHPALADFSGLLQRLSHGAGTYTTTTHLLYPYRYYSVLMQNTSHCWSGWDRGGHFHFFYLLGGRRHQGGEANWAGWRRR